MDATFGASFDGLVVSLILFGVTCGQAIQYFRTYPSDSSLLKMMVGGTWIMDTLHSVLLAHNTWHYLISHTTADELEMANWSLIIQVIPTEIIAVTVDCFFIHRIWIISERNRWVSLLLLPTLLVLLISIAYVVKCFHLPRFVDARKSTWLLGLFSSLRATVDLSIALAMCYLLIRKRTEFKRTRSIIRTLVHYTMATGVVTSFVTFAYIIAFFTMQTNMVYIAIYFVHGKVYLNSMLASLNSRVSLREIANQDVQSFISRRHLASAGTSQTFTSTLRTRKQAEV